jgi:hypothetical protein
MGLTVVTFSREHQLHSKLQSLQMERDRLEERIHSVDRTNDGDCKLIPVKRGSLSMAAYAPPGFIYFEDDGIIYAHNKPTPNCLAIIKFLRRVETQATQATPKADHESN